MANRNLLAQQFAAATPWRDATMKPLTGDASFRRYFRFAGGPAPALLMDAPPERESVAAFVQIARHLRGIGLSAPEIFEADEQQGFLILEDFGDDTFAQCLARGDSAEALYALATDTLITLHQHEPPSDVAPFGEDRILREVQLALDWYWPEVHGQPATGDTVESFLAQWRALLPILSADPQRLVLFDYFPENLMHLPSRDGVAACGLLDFQDAVVGSVAYDVVSLLGDARRDVADDLRRAMIARYLAAFPNLDPTEFTAAAAVASAQRNLRIIGVFTRLLRRDGKAHYVDHLPRVWRLLAQDLEHPALADLKDWLDRAIPIEKRSIPERA